jgi:ribonuclease BN (tRNA processing enzyme)
MSHQEYPIVWHKNNFSIKIFCSIPNIATGILLRTDSKICVIDPGDGILRDLNEEIGTSNILKISDLFITHGHHDHVGGVWSLLTYLRVMRKTTPISIYYPSGCIEIESIYNAFMKVYSKNLTYKINMREIKEYSSIKSDEIEITPFPVIHKEFLNDGVTTRQVPALGYKFKYKDTSICYGGDTAYCEALAESAKGSDLAILEAGHEEDTPDDMHMSAEEAKTIGESAKEYFLVHVPD